MFLLASLLGVILGLALFFGVVAPALRDVGAEMRDDRPPRHQGDACDVATGAVVVSALLSGEGGEVDVGFERNSRSNPSQRSRRSVDRIQSEPSKDAPRHIEQIGDNEVVDEVFGNR